MKLIDYLTSAFLGTSHARRELGQAIASKPCIVSGLSERGRLCAKDFADDLEAPIFLLSAGWRSGSTLLQRLIIADPQVLLWGEP